MGGYKLVYHAGTPTTKNGYVLFLMNEELHNDLRNIPKQRIDKTTVDTRINFT